MVIAMAASTLTGTGAAAGVPQCNGLAATIVATSGTPTIGTAGDDVVVGTAGDDIIRGRGGNDVICGRGGDDIINGGSGHDIIFGESGNDIISGNTGNDHIYGGSGSDQIRGGRGTDRVRGGSGQDEIFGGRGNDRIHGGAGFDAVYGGRGRDKCFTAEVRSSCLRGLSLTIVASLPPGHQAGIAVSPPGDPRLFLVGQSGPIWEIGPGGYHSTPLLDLTGRISTGSEQGVLGLAFHPAFVDNGRFFVFFTQPNGDIMIQEFEDDGSWPIDPDSGSDIIEIEHGDATNHNGGMLAFGADGYLYASIGDGGTGGHEAQDTTSLLGTIIRLDVDSATPYAVPATNPFVGGPGANEIWAYGLRNPWRFSLDQGLIYVGDVGQSTREEVNVSSLSSGGLNYGWPVLEGTDCHSPSSGCSSVGTVLPVHEEEHSTGVCSVIGGYVYRGDRMPELDGHYLFSDFCRGFVKSFRHAGGNAEELTTWIASTGHLVTSFGMDADGELYVATLAGDLYRITPVR